MVRGDGYVKVLDFGLARQMAVETAGSGLPAGTLRYMSPEQIRGEPLTGASDVFSLGLTLYELLTGRHPFESSSAFETAVAIAQEEPQAPSQWNGFVPPRLEALVLRMLAKDPGARPSAGEIARMLAAIQREPESVPTEARPKRKNARPRDSRRTWIAAAVGLMLLAAGLVWFARKSMLATAEPALRQITATPSENRVTTAAISSDGEKLAYAVFDGTLFIRRSAGDVQTVPAQPDFRIDRIAWWPDERRLLVSGYSTTTQRSEFVDCSPRRSRALPAARRRPGWIAFAGRDQSGLHSKQSVRDLDDGAGQPVGTKGGGRQKHGYLPGSLMVDRRQACHLPETTLFPPARFAYRRFNCSGSGLRAELRIGQHRDRAEWRAPRGKFP